MALSNIPAHAGEGQHTRRNRRSPRIGDSGGGGGGIRGAEKINGKGCPPKQGRAGGGGGGIKGAAINYWQGCTTQNRQERLFLPDSPDQTMRDRSWRVQLVARWQICCPAGGRWGVWGHLKLKPFPSQSRHNTPKQFRKLTSCLFVETCNTLNNQFRKKALKAATPLLGLHIPFFKSLSLHFHCTRYREKYKDKIVPHCVSWASRCPHHIKGWISCNRFIARHP